MKTHTHYTTPIAPAPWMQRNVAALAALATLLIGLAFVLGRFGQLSNNALRGAVAGSARPLIAFCRECADEVLGAAQTSQGSLTPHAAVSAVRQYAIVPRLFRDEMIGADQANLAFLSVDAAQRPSGAARASAAPVIHLLVAGPRAFRDDVLGADQANLAFLSIDTARRPSQAAPATPAVYQQLAGPRAFRDDVLGADQANLASFSAFNSAPDSQQDSSRRAGPR